MLIEILPFYGVIDIGVSNQSKLSTFIHTRDILLKLSVFSFFFGY